MYDMYLCTYWMKKDTVLKKVFIEHESLLSVLTGSLQQSRVSEVPVMPCEMCSWPQASYHQPGQIALLPQLPNAWKGENLTAWALSHWWSPFMIYSLLIKHTAMCTQTGMYAPISTFTQKHNTVLASTRTIALCPVEFACPVAEHNKVFTLRHFS